MRTTIEINDELLREAKRLAADRGSSMRKVVEAALLAYLKPGSQRGKYRLRWRTESGTIRPGVRLDDRDALFDLMDGGE